MINIMNKLMPTLLVFFLAFFISFCSKNGGRETSVGGSGGVVIPQTSPDMVIHNFEFREISQKGVDVDFTARRANYFKGVDFVSFEKVEGVFKGDQVPYYFTLPEAVYDIEIKSLVSSGRVLITASDVFRLTGSGGVFDFEHREAILERDVLLKSGTLSVTGERGIMDFKEERFRLERVEAHISDLTELKEELGEVIR